VRATAVHRLPYLYRSEVTWRAVEPRRVHRLPTRACRLPVRRHQLQPSLDKTVIEPRLCYGCGTCRAHCARADLAERPAERSGGGQLVVGAALEFQHRARRAGGYPLAKAWARAM